MNNIKSIFFILALSLSYTFDFIDIYAVFVSLFYFFCCYLFSFNKRSISNTVIGFVIFILSIILLLHFAPGFNNFLVLDAINVSDNAKPYSLYFNFDKLLVAFALLSCAIPRRSKAPNSNYLVIFIIIIASYFLAISITLFTGLVEFDFKLPSYLVYWCIINLFITVYAEEAFFRGFIQSAIGFKLEGSKHKTLITVLSSGCIFGLVHFPAGMIYVFVATLLGCTYAFTYLRSGNNIYIPIMGHFIFNLIHFIFFTYPLVL